MQLAERMSRLGTETAFEVLAAAKALEAAGHNVIHLEIGEPDFDTPRHIVDAAVEALRSGAHHYTPASGIPAFREVIAREVSDSRRITVEPDQVVVTPGGKPIIFFSLLALADTGDEVIYPNPGFPIYESMIRYVGAKPVPIPLREELDFRLDVDELLGLITDRTRLIIINSPSNPTGSVLTTEDLEAIAASVVDRNLMVLSDEIYGRILYEGKHDSIARFPGMQEKTIILDGFSKAYAMTGWRLGYGVMQPELAVQIGKLMINSNSCTAAFTQLAGIAALTQDQGPTLHMVETFRGRRDRLVDLLNSVEGVSCRTPKGAFYAFPNVRSFGRTSREIQNLLLKTADLALLSGSAFGEFGEGYLRFSYAASMDKLEEGVRRMATVLESLRVGR